MMTDQLEAWRQKASRGGKTDLDALTAITDDGISFGPIYAASGAAVVPGRGARPWTIFERIDGETPLDRAFAQTVDGGADGLALVLDHAPGRRAGTTRATLDAVKPFIRKSGDATLRLEPGETELSATASLLSDHPHAALVFDPFACLAAQGFLATPLTGLAEIAIAHAETGHATIVADGRFWHDCGATEAQELALVASAVMELLRRAKNAGVHIDRTAPHLGVMVAIDANQFLNIAKLRALRLLLAQIFSEVGVETTVQVHAETSWRMTTRRDPYLNMLRATSAVVAAATGGADSITVSPLPLSDPDFSARMARNIQIMAQAESFLARVSDPGAGSGAVEDLTESIAAAAWDSLRTIENGGGLTEALTEGSVQRMIATARDTRQDKIARREIEIVGVNVHVDREAKQAPPQNDMALPAVPANPAIVVPPMTPSCLAEAFEQSGDQALAIAEAGSPPTVFVAGFGGADTAGMIDALAALGLPVIDGGSCETPDQLASAFRQSGARAAAIAAGSDGSPDLDLKGAGAKIVIGDGIADTDAELSSSTNLPALGAFIMDRLSPQ